MEETLNEKVKKLQEEIILLKTQIANLSLYSGEKSPSTTSIVGGVNKSTLRPVDTKTGFGRVCGGAVIWNDTELKTPPINGNPVLPTEGFNKHSHSEFSGGALINGVAEAIEFKDLNDVNNVHSQQYWQTIPKIATAKNTKGEIIEKKGKLDLIFEPDSKTWGMPSYEIDVKKCYLVERGEDGLVIQDSKGQLKMSLLYNTDSTKSAIIWDENAKVWRFYAVYASGA